MDWHRSCYTSLDGQDGETPTAPRAPYYCRIEVRGRPDFRWAGRFIGLSVSHDEEETVLEGLIEDQTDFYGYLFELAALKLPVASLSFSEIGEEDLAAELN